MTNRKRRIQKKFWIDQDENKAIRARMNNFGITDFSLYGRTMCVDGIINVAESKGMLELKNQLAQTNYQLAKIGNNLNQIAKTSNENLEIDIQELGELRKILQVEFNNLSQMIKTNLVAGERRE